MGSNSDGAVENALEEVTDRVNALTLVELGNDDKGKGNVLSKSVEIFPLLRLPAELRNLIYDMLFTGHHIDLGAYDRSNYRKSYATFYSGADSALLNVTHFFPLAKTCRQLRREIGLLPFSANTFVKSFRRSGYRQMHLYCLSLEKREAITSIHIPMSTFHGSSVAQSTLNTPWDAFDIYRIFCYLPQVKRITVTWGDVGYQISKAVYVDRLREFCDAKGIKLEVIG